jgi:hypothetical protein
VSLEARRAASRKPPLWNLIEGIRESLDGRGRPGARGGQNRALRIRSGGRLGAAANTCNANQEETGREVAEEASAAEEGSPGPEAVTPRAFPLAAR